ncbi:MAG: gliding motility-associated C-terminal domain-containing protein [Bacteroidales bacterium]|nr:gliding motility-associated C-terminal domain-containing protein [Bacteroidales bacterium]
MNLLPVLSQGQDIVYEGVRRTACLTDSIHIRVGLAAGSEVQVMNRYTAISHPEVAFLPDGKECNGSCSYQSPITFSGFAASDTIRSVQNIKYVRLNIEHSWMGDIFIGLTCPNGQRTSLMKYSNNGTSSCTQSIPAQMKGWSGTSHVPTSTHLGGAYDYEAYSEYCDPNASGNEPGTGWNYCWSENTTSGYTYRGYIYASGNNSYGNTIDSSNVAQGRKFYRPDGGFEALVGCPVNGDWYIEVMDGWSVDNGYAFDWELNLDPSFIPRAGVMTANSVTADPATGGVVTQVDDSTYLVSAPADAVGDTNVRFTVHIVGTGHTIDTTVSILFSSDHYHLIQQTLCAGDSLVIDDTLVVRETTHRLDTVAIGSGCIDVREIDVTVAPVYDLYDTMVLCPTDTFAYNNIDYTGPGDYVVYGLSSAGCDSTMHLNVTDADTLFAPVLLVSDDGEAWWSDTLLAGCRPYRVMVRDTSQQEASRRWFFGDGGSATDTLFTHTYDSAGHYDITLTAVSLHGCHDTVVLHDAVYVYELPRPSFWWAPVKPTMSHPAVQFYNESEPYDSLTFRWEIATTDGTDTAEDATPYYSWQSGGAVSGDFLVVLNALQAYVTPTGDTLVCSDTVQHTIEIVNDWLQFPNLVTPNGDGTSDIWKVVGLLEAGVYTLNELWIYNAWGARVYHARNISSEDDFWDPEKTSSPDGTYYYRFMAKSPYGAVRRTGMIEVVR